MCMHVLAGAMLAVCAAVSGGGPAPAAAPAPTAAASGEGTMSFGHDDDGRGYLRFDITAGETASGSLLFAGEHHDDDHMAFPDVIIELGLMVEADFQAHAVKFSGPGQLHEDPVTVTVHAYDRSDRKKPDRFVIKCTNRDGKVVFEADGELFRGDIVVSTG